MVVLLSEQSTGSSAGQRAHHSTVARLARCTLSRRARLGVVVLVLGLRVVVLSIGWRLVGLVGLAICRLSLVATAGCVTVVLRSRLAVLPARLALIASLGWVLLGRVRLLVLLEAAGGMAVVSLVVTVARHDDGAVVLRD